MATTVNLNLGGDSNDQVINVDLVLSTPYEEPNPRLLVLRSRPDIEPVTGTLDTSNGPDAVTLEGFAGRKPDLITGTFATTGKASVSSFTANAAVPAISGEWNSLAGTATSIMEGESSGRKPRTGPFHSTTAEDTASFTSAYTLKWVATAHLEPVQHDVAMEGGFLEYVGPGYVNITEREDTSSWVGRVTYDCDGTFETDTLPDQVDVVARTAGYEETENTDVVQANETLTGNTVAAPIVDWVRGTDTVVAFEELNLVDALSASDSVSGELRVLLSFVETARATEKLAAIYYQSATDVVRATETLLSERGYVNLLDTAASADALASTLKVSVRTADVVALSETVTAHHDTLVVDAIQAADDLAGDLVLDAEGFIDRVGLDETLNAELTLALADHRFVRDVISTEWTETLADSAVAADAAAPFTGFLSAALADTVTAADAVSVINQVDGTISDVVVAHEVLIGPAAAAAEALADIGVAVEVLGFIPYTQAPVLADVVVATETLVMPLAVYAPLVDVVQATDALTSRLSLGLSLVGVLSDTVLAGDSLHEAVQTVYVVNAETGAVSTFQFTPTIRSMTEYQGVLYLAGPQGLYALDAVQDDDGDVVWTLRTGFSNLGTDQLKRVQDVNFQARTEGDTTFQAVSDRYGKKQEWNYRLPPLTRDSYRDGVVKVGRGIQSVYWQFAAEGVGPAEIDQLRLVVEPLSRRR